MPAKILGSVSRRVHIYSQVRKSTSEPVAHIANLQKWDARKGHFYPRQNW